LKVPGLPRPLKRLIVKRYSTSPAGRIATAAMLGAFGTLLRKHPKAVLDMTGAGLKQAGSSALGEIKHVLVPGDDRGGDAKDPSSEGAALPSAERKASAPERRS
jgi:hypothetical protein